MYAELAPESVLRARLACAIERNARAIVVLRHQAARLHRLMPKHLEGWWAKCNHVDCRAVLALIHEARP